MEIDREVVLRTDRVPGQVHLQNSLSNLLPEKFQTNFVSVKEERFEAALSSQVLGKDPASEVSVLNKNNENLDAATSARSPANCLSSLINRHVPPLSDDHDESKINSEPDVTNGRLHRRAQIDVIDAPSEEACIYKCFFVYEDQLSKFVVLKALRNNTAKEVARKLLDILALIGAPQVLQSSNGRTFAEQVVRELRSLWNGLAILHGEISRREENKRDFNSLLKRWLQENPTRTWYEGLKFIQLFQNSTFQCRNGKIPCDILFGRNVHEEYQKMTVASEPNETVLAEEEWIRRLSNKRENNVNEETSDGENGSSSFLDARDFDSHEREGDSDSPYEFTESPVKVRGFNFVNVKSELPLNNETEGTEFAYESVADDPDMPSTANEDLKCRICRKQYMKPGHLKNHIKTHAKGKKFECTLCKKTFHVRSLYDKHMRQSHGQDRMCSPGRKRRRKDSVASELKSEEPLDKSSLVLSLAQQSEMASDGKGAKSFGPGPTKRKCPTDSRTKFVAEPTLECTFCKQKFCFPSVLKRHMRSHTNERPYVCEVCNKSFKQLGHLSQHSLTHKDYRSFQCTVCNVKFESFESLKTHSQSHKGEAVARTKDSFRLFECDNCKKVFTTKSVLERHIFTHTHERQFGCKVCGKRFKQAGHVKSHMLVHTGERKFECTVCQKRFSLSNSLKKHMYVHNGEKPYQCDVCGARFLEKRNLNGHLMTHTNERPFRCKICGKRYTLADTLRRHISAAHEDGRTYQCEICAKMFKQLAHLSVHKKVHNDERPFQCHLCDKNFKHKNVLKSHLAIHANVRPFECDVCKATFVRKTNLQTHIASAHMNERPYACTICGKRFKQISHLNGHVVVHSNSMPYKCDYCDRRCNRLDNLKKHMRLHTKNKE